jgi:hypothetical protein
MAHTSPRPGVGFKNAFYAFPPMIANSEQYLMSSVGVTTADDLVGSVEDNTDWVSPDQEITHLLVECFREVPEVVSICAQFGVDGIAIWTLLEAYNPDARDRVYDKELDICRRLGLCDFDFRVSSVDLVSPQDLLLAGSIEIFKRLRPDGQ